MLKRISVLLLSALLTVGLTANVAMGNTVTPPDQDKIHDDKGQPNADEEKETGAPDDPNAWGSVAAQLADEGVMGAHSSDPVPTGCFGENKELNCRETPRDGLGNVAKNDFDDHGVPTGTAEECAAVAAEDEREIVGRSERACDRLRVIEHQVFIAHAEQHITDEAPHRVDV